MRSNQRLTLIWLICLSLGLALASCASGAAPTGATGNATRATPMPQTTAPIDGSGFVCANAPGSNKMYAYVGDSGHQMYLVKSCSAPISIPAATGWLLAPIAFSSSGTWLLAWDNSADSQDPSAQSCLAFISIATNAVTPTKLCNVGAFSGGWPHWYDFIGWASDTSFYLSIAAPDSSVSVALVTIPGLAQTSVTKLTWVATLATHSAPAGIVLRGDALFYGGYMSTNESGAWLHRFSLTSHTDTRIVRLGVAGTGGCQVTSTPCQWTGPWDISADGAQIAYHAPGPTQSITDTTTEAGTPLYVAGSDGSNARRLFPGVALGQGFATPMFSLDGRYVAATFQNQTYFERLTDGAITVAPAEMPIARWTVQPGVALLNNAGLELFTLATNTRTPLPSNTYGYVWS